MATPDLTSRRRFLGAAGAGVAVIGVAGATSAFASTGPSLGDDTVVLTVANADKGEFTINVGERSVPITDLEFASKIAKAIA